MSRPRNLISSLDKREVPHERLNASSEGFNISLSKLSIIEYEEPRFLKLIIIFLEGLSVPLSRIVSIETRLRGATYVKPQRLHFQPC